MKKIIVIGCPGSGKSTFSKKLHQIIGAPLFHLDMMYWNPDRTTVDKTIFHNRLIEAMAQPEWIIDGNYGATMELRLQNCDTVFFLDYPVKVCLDGIRSRKGMPRSDMPWFEGEHEQSDEEFIAFIRNYNQDNRPKVVDLLEKYAHKEIFVLRGRLDAERFLQALKQKTDG